MKYSEKKRIIPGPNCLGAEGKSCEFFCAGQGVCQDSGGCEFDKILGEKGPKLFGEREKSLKVEINKERTQKWFSKLPECAKIFFEGATITITITVEADDYIEEAGEK